MGKTTGSLTTFYPTYTVTREIFSIFEQARKNKLVYGFKRYGKSHSLILASILYGMQSTFATLYIPNPK